MLKIKLIPIAGAIVGAAIGAVIDSDPWRGAMIGAFFGGGVVPGTLWLLWVAACKAFGVRVQ